ncbi:hypothetical protein GCM10009679_55000 [Saccharothrix algeriensis]|uniref:Uncharacterized protein n=2 Tax=Micromonosporaceae TaxID=28056 RepID=A0A8J3NLM8_9ACTN|nr:hypothetical protein Cba03nite_65610 [Catellatospora bangladeshensis]
MNINLRRTEDRMPSDRLINRRFVYNGHQCTVVDYDGDKRLAIVMDDQPHEVYSVNIDIGDDPTVGRQLDLFYLRGEFYAWPAVGRGKPPALAKHDIPVEPSTDL